MQIIRMVYIGGELGNGYQFGVVYTLCILANINRILVYSAEEPAGILTYEDVTQFFEHWRLQ
jgi:hypothetical protein